MADLRRDLRLSTLLQEHQGAHPPEGALPRTPSGHGVSTGDLIPLEARPGETTADPDHLATQRFGIGDRTTQIVRAASYPSRPCALCLYWRHDQGQEILRHEGLKQVPAEEGGFLQEGARPWQEQETAGPYDAREVGLCTQARRGLRLSHRFATCTAWQGRGRFDR